MVPRQPRARRHPVAVGAPAQPDRSTSARAFLAGERWRSAISWPSAWAMRSAEEPARGVGAVALRADFPILSKPTGLPGGFADRRWPDIEVVCEPIGDRTPKPRRTLLPRVLRRPSRPPDAPWFRSHRRSTSYEERCPGHRPRRGRACGFDLIGDRPAMGPGERALPGACGFDLIGDRPAMGPCPDARERGRRPPRWERALMPASVVVGLRGGRVP
jgi:hypothetical protein